MVLDLINIFAASLESSGQLAQQLEIILTNEAQAIEARDPTQLQQLIIEQKKLIIQLEQETTQQKQWVEQNGYNFNPEGMQAFLVAWDHENQLNTRWSFLQDKIFCCAQLNRINAGLLERKRKRVNNLLRLLGADLGTTTIYNPRGGTETSNLHGRINHQA